MLESEMVNIINENWWKSSEIGNTSDFGKTFIMSNPYSNDKALLIGISDDECRFCNWFRR